MTAFCWSILLLAAAVALIALGSAVGRLLGRTHRHYPIVRTPAPQRTYPRPHLFQEQR